MSEEKVIETIVAGGDEELKIEIKPITMIFKAPDFHKKLSYPGRVELDSEAAMYHMERVKVFHEHTPRMVAQVFKSKDTTLFTPDYCRQAGTGVMCCAGLIDLTLKLMEKDVPIVWIHPEAFLHPAAQCELADIIIEFATNPPETIARKDDRIMGEIADKVVGEE